MTDINKERIKSAPVSPIDYGMYQMEKQVLDELKIYCEELFVDPLRSKQKYNNKTPSHIEHQYAANKEITSIVVSCAKQLAENIYQKLPDYLMWAPTPLWVSYQKKHEFIPPTEMFGNDLGFFCIVKVPFDIEEEMSLPHVKESTNPSAGKHTLYYTNPLGKTSHREFVFTQADEGVLVLYPSSLLYTLNPFYTSDDHHIIIQGSLVVTERPKAE
jgi:hypothetical protein